MLAHLYKIVKNILGPQFARDFVKIGNGMNVKIGTAAVATGTFLLAAAALAENASNPLSKGRNTDILVQSTCAESGDTTD